MRDLIRIENIKLRGKNINYYVLLTAIVPFIICGVFYFMFKDAVYEEAGSSIVLILAKNMFITMLFPIFTLYISFAIGREEHLGGGWKLLFTYPIEKKFAYISKITVVLLNQIKVLGVFLIIFIFVKLTNNFVIADIFEILGKSVLGLIGYLPFLIIVFYLSMKFTSPAVPMSSGIIVIILNSAIINSEKYAKLIPTTYGISMFSSEITSESIYMFIISILIFVVLTIMAIKELKNGVMI